MLQLQSPSIPGTYSTKIWMSTELAENQDLGPLGYPHHHGVLGFWRIFYTNLKIAQGLRGALCQKCLCIVALFSLSTSESES